MISQRCERCGKAIPLDAPGDRCPSCYPSSDQGLASTVLMPAARNDPHHLTKVELGPYVLQEEIGRGGMGVVYRAVHKELKRKVAIKVILTGAGGEADRHQLELFLAEARAVARVRHPNVVGIYDVGEIHGWHYMAMELIEGRSLAELVEERWIEPEQAAGTALRIARAMEYLHRRGIIHRDIKPSNILIDAEGVPYISDLGLAKVRELASALSLAGLVAGTPSYMSPEQASGNAEGVAQASDVYSLGAVLYQLLTRRPPFCGKTVSDTLLQVMHHDPVAPRQIRAAVPADLEYICLKCLAKSPGERYASMAELAEDLNRFLQGETIARRVMSASQRILFHCRRNPATAARLLCLGLFFSIEQVWHLAFGITTHGLYLTTTILVPIWLVATIAFSRALDRNPESDILRCLWLTGDVLFLTGILLAGEGLQQSPLVMLYPVLIVASGLWNRVRIVRLASLLCVCSNLLLWVIPTYLVTSSAQAPLHVHLVFCMILIVVGMLVSSGVRQGQIFQRYSATWPNGRTPHLR